MELKDKALLLTATILLAGSAGASAQDTCTSLANSIEHSLKVIASENAEGIGDNSAPRATLSELKINNQLLLISMHLQLMRDHGCAERKGPISLSSYLIPALECKTAMTQMRVGRDVPKMEGGQLPAACNMPAWKPMSDSESVRSPVPDP